MHWLCTFHSQVLIFLLASNISIDFPRILMCLFIYFNLFHGCNFPSFALYCFCNSANVPNVGLIKAGATRIPKTDTPGSVVPLDVHYGAEALIQTKIHSAIVEEESGVS